MAQKFKLVVSDRIEFDVKFTLNDGGDEKPFGMRLAAKRQTLDQQQQEMDEQVKVIEFLEGRGLVMQAWIGKSPLVDDEGNPVPPGKEALSALFDLVNGSVGLVFAAYLAANSIKGKQGN